MSTLTTAIHPIDSEHRVVVTCDRAWVVDREKTKISRDELRPAGLSDQDWTNHATAWASRVAAFISPGN